MSNTVHLPEPSGADPLIASRLARWALGLRPGDIPAPVREHALLCMLDGVGIGLASGAFPFAARAIAGLRPLASAGDSPVIGQAMRLAPRDAMLLNGILIHGLDFDDTHAGSVVHATASALPTALANGLAHGASGSEALASYIVALEADARLGAVAQGRFQHRGHHPTGMIGAYGATLCAGRLSGLTLEQLVSAQGIVLSMASGSLEFLDDGDWTKRMHPGWAAVSATTATALAAGGFLGPKRAYEGRYGLYNLHLGADHGLDITGVGEDLGAEWETLNIAFKPYPACHFNHAFIDAALALREAPGFAAENVEAITVRLHPRQVGVVCEPFEKKRRPSSDYDAQFSLPYAVAVTLLRGHFTLGDLEAATRSDEEVLALIDRVSYEIDPNSAYPTHYSGEITVAFKDGNRVTQRQAVNRGARENPLAPADVEAKFFANAERVIDRAHAEQIRDLLLNLDQQADLTGLASALVSER
ncbi:MAG: MmgE/PrpD family protein [Pseudomonadota bacterium]